MDKAVGKDFYLKEKQITVREKEALISFSGGDARKLLNILELVVNAQSGTEVVVDNETVRKELQENPLMYDKDGEQHYDIISAMIKSVRGSDPNALLMANACFDVVHKVGMPEARIPLSECLIYLATSPKSNSAYLAIDAAMQLVKESGNVAVPLHLRNAPTQLMKQLNYGKEYKYAHDFPGNFADQEYLPEEVKSAVFYKPQANAQEVKILERLKVWWKKKYK